MTDRLPRPEDDESPAGPDRRDFADALFLLRYMEPLTITATFQKMRTADRAGFYLQDVELPGDAIGPGITETRLAELNRRLSPLLISVGWESILGEDESSTITINVREWNPLQ